MSWNPRTALIRWRPCIFLATYPHSVEVREDDIQISSFLLPITPPDPPIAREYLPKLDLNARLFALLTVESFIISPYPDTPDLSFSSPPPQVPNSSNVSDEVQDSQEVEEDSLESIDESSVYPDTRTTVFDLPREISTKKINPFLKRNPSRGLTHEPSTARSGPSGIPVLISPDFNAILHKAGPQIMLTGSTAPPHTRPDDEDLFLDLASINNSPAIPDNTKIASATEEEDSARNEQWKVGKRPGHQGSHVRADSGRQGSEGSQEKRGEKRSLGQSINESAERVLKKPFKPPKVVLAKAARKSSSPPSSKKRSSSSGSDIDIVPDYSSSTVTPLGSTPRVKSGIRRKPSPHPMFPENRIHTSKLSQPFKTPTRTTHTSTETLPSGSTTVCSSRSSRSELAIRLPPATNNSVNTGSNHVKALESRARRLREALGYLNSLHAEEELENLTLRWLTAGQEIESRLSDLLPAQTTPGEAGDNAWSQDRYNPVNPFSGTFAPITPLSEEQKDWLAKVDRDEDGNPIDEDGNLFMRDIGGENSW